MSIWKYKELKQYTNFNINYSLSEGDTSTDEIKLGSTRLLIKREDLNPTGSWKDRATAFKLSQLADLGVKQAVISSSGNAAISFASFIHKLNLDFKLHVVISNKSINPEKLEILIDLKKQINLEIYESAIPKQKRAEIISKTGSYNLSASTDSEIIKAYWTLGFEIASLIKNYSSKELKETYLFVPVSSGTALVGLVQGLGMRLNDDYGLPKIIVCQTSKIHPVADMLGENVTSEESNLADAIIEKTVLRSPQILKIVNETDGKALAITNKELESAKEFIGSKLDVRSSGLSYTSLLSTAALLRLKNQGMNIKTAVCIASGR